MASYDIRPLQLRILDILLALDKVCKEHNLRYYLWAGTMLGAIRHKGFIPWDDDLDIAMPRKDYDPRSACCLRYGWSCRSSTPAARDRGRRTRARLSRPVAFAK